MSFVNRRVYLPFIVLWLALSLIANSLEVAASRARYENAFQTDARIMHRLLSQRAVQHEAILETLALLQPGSGLNPAQEEYRLPAVYPQILRVERWVRSDVSTRKLPAALEVAADESLRLRRAVLASIDVNAGNYWLVLASHPATYALQIDIQAMLPKDEWPIPREGSPVRVVLEFDAREVVISAGSEVDGGWLGQKLSFNKTIAADSQQFNISVSRELDLRSLPSVNLVLWTLGCAMLCGLFAWLQLQRQARMRAEELLRFGQVSRLNTLGELAAGLAHELNQPLAAVTANTQAASRLLNEEPADLDTARRAMGQAVGQARRAADVLSRLRRAIERPGMAERLESVSFFSAARNVLALLQVETHRLGLVPVLQGAPNLQVKADPVALEQIMHNLLVNALQAMEGTPKPLRKLGLRIDEKDGWARLFITDGGPGIPQEALTRLFEPFFSTKEGGLGLGLSLCETLASGMGGRVSVTNTLDGGAEFCLSLPLAMKKG